MIYSPGTTIGEMKRYKPKNYSDEEVEERCEKAMDKLKAKQQDGSNKRILCVNRDNIRTRASMEMYK